MPNAYDYQAQRWITGEPARQLLLKQQQETLDVLQSAAGADYARFTGVGQAAAIESAKRAIAELHASA